MIAVGDRCGQWSILERKSKYLLVPSSMRLLHSLSADLCSHTYACSDHLWFGLSSISLLPRIGAVVRFSRSMLGGKERLPNEESMQV